MTDRQRKKECQTKTERNIVKTERDRKRPRQADRQTNRKTQKDTDETDRQISRKTDILRDRETNRQ